MKEKLAVRSNLRSQFCQDIRMKPPFWYLMVYVFHTHTVISSVAARLHYVKVPELIRILDGL
jgi:hypothetical protein